MSQERHDRISKRAHEKWEREGRPHDAQQRHWHEAAKEIDAEMASGAKAKPAKAPAKSAAKAPAKAAAAAKAPAKKPAASKAKAKPKG